MFLPGRLAPKLLIWLTAIAMPLQAGWATARACSSATMPAAATSSSPAQGCHCEAPTPKQSCCREAPKPVRNLGCSCAAGCLCQRDDSPGQPPVPAPAPVNGRAASAVELAVSQVALTDLPADGDCSDAPDADYGSALYESGAQACAILCRFTL